MICWAYSFIWTKQALASFPPITLIMLRVLLASILLYIFAKATRKFKIIEKKDIKIFLILAFFEPFLYFVGETYGLTKVQPTLTSVIIATIPIFAPIFAYFMLKEKISKFNIIGILLSIVGVFLIVNLRHDNSTSQFSGILLLLLAVFSAVLYTIVLRKIPTTYSAINIVLYQSLFSLIFFIPTFFIVDFPTISEIKILPKAIQSLFLLTIFASVIAFVCFASTVRRMGVAKTQIFVNLIPVLTAVLSWVVLKEKLFFIQWIGIFVVLIGVFISQRQKMITDSIY